MSVVILPSLPFTSWKWADRAMKDILLLLTFFMEFINTLHTLDFM